MTKVILKGPPQCQWDINGHMIPGGTEVDLTTSELTKHKDVILEKIQEKKELKEEVKEIKKEIPTPKPLPEQVKELKYTKQSLKEIYEKKGIDALRKIAKKFKVKFRSIDEGIKEILEAQK